MGLREIILQMRALHLAKFDREPSRVIIDFTTHKTLVEEINYSNRLTKDRLDISELKEFMGMKVEIDDQMLTTLIRLR